MMRLLDLFRSRRAPATPAVPPAAVVAKERLQILLAHERADRGRSAEFLPALQQEILDVIAKYLVIDQDKVMVRLERGKDISVLEVNVELPGPDVQLLRPIKPVAVATAPEIKAETKVETAVEATVEEKAADRPAEKAVEKAEAPVVANTAGPLAHSAA